MVEKIGLVLGGGGSRGIAHIGVLQVLVREHISIDLIVGTSMGGIIGTLFAAGFAPEKIAEHIRLFQGNNLLGLNLFSGRARQDNISALLGKELGDKTFADLTIPTVLMAVDMVSGQEICLDSGPLLPSLLATSAVPAVFPPVEIDGMQLADGGVIDSLATHIAFARGATKVIAVDVYPPLEDKEPWVDPVGGIIGLSLPFRFFSRREKNPTMLASIWRSVRVMTWHLHQARLSTYKPDVLLRPEVHHYASMDFRDIEGPLTAGIAIAETHLESIKALFLLEETIGASI